MKQLIIILMFALTFVSCERYYQTEPVNTTEHAKISRVEVLEKSNITTTSSLLIIKVDTIEYIVITGSNGRGAITRHTQ